MTSELAATIKNGVRFWEPSRILYNLILTFVALVRLVAGWSRFRSAMNLSSLGLSVVLALIANICYCAAYLADIPMQQSPVREEWIRVRWVLWLLGMAFAVVLENYWIADEIYPYLH